MCESDKRVISLCSEFIDYETLVHELVHAFYAETCTNSADLDDEQVEEVFCELFSHNDAEILRLAKLIIGTQKS